jgi:cell division initiation protein
MKITPLEIRQKTFERTLRGYDKDEVNAFLLSLSQEWERTQDEVKELRIKLEAAEREVGKLREVETSLYKTLKTAEDTGANVVEQARKAAELQLREAQLKADGLLNEARQRAKHTLEEAEAAAKQALSDMEARLKELIHLYKSIEQHRDNLVADVQRIATDTLDRMARARAQQSDFKPEDLLNEVKREIKKTLQPAQPVEKTPPPLPPPPKPTPAPEAKSAPAAPVVQKSFFDEIE